MRFRVITFGATILTSMAGCANSRPPLGAIVNEHAWSNVCSILASPTEFTNDTLVVTAVIVPNYFDGPAIRVPGCASALGLGRLPPTSTCRALEEALGLPGYEPQGDVTVTLEGQIEATSGRLPRFRASACSNVQVARTLTRRWS